MSDRRPVVLFNASTRLTGLSLNAAFSSLLGWSLRLSGIPVKQFVCSAGLKPCVLGASREDYTSSPPCANCLAQSRRLYSGADVAWFTFQPDQELSAILEPLGLDELIDFSYRPSPHRTNEHPGAAWLRSHASQATIPLGRLVAPSIRWALRRHHLYENDGSDAHSDRYLLRQFLLSAYSVAKEFAALLEQTNPETAVIFNGMMYPEATARWVAQQRGVRVVTHEVGFQRLSTFFTEGEATAYPIDIPEDFELTAEQNQALDQYLEKRFQGQFAMAGIRFWPEMRGLDEAFLQRAAGFRQVVPIFTNVVYDTSQVHANTIFPHMFAWLDLLLEIIRTHPETLFVIRAHPDEMRAGTRKLSRESVRDWVQRNGVNALPNVVFIDSQEYLSSYELVLRSRFVIVYNSSIGMEAALLNRAVLCGGKARYTQYPIVHFPQDPQSLRQQIEAFLEEGDPDTPTPIPPEFQRNARRFLYYQLYRTSLPLDHYLDVGKRMGFVQLKSFGWRDLLPENSLTMQVLYDGIVNHKPFMLPA